mmetsp:Transcript_112528/g.223651  ORF Transcript_112528/g.223651 Transcript_112528/m.223651 type:complete len:345 (+) Transcript_112528:82-1116(+)
MGSTISAPRNGARMAVPMDTGQQAAWPVSTLPLESLEAAAQDWYAFRDHSCSVRLYRHFGCITVLMVLCLVFSSVPMAVWRVMPKNECRLSLSTDRCFRESRGNVDECDRFSEMGHSECHVAFFDKQYLCVERGSPCGPREKMGGIIITILVQPLGMLFVMGLFLYIKCCMLKNLNEEAQRRLATPLTELLAGTGWVVQARYLRRGKGTRAPESLPQGCCSPGWFWLDFEPSGAMPVVGAPVAALTQQPVHSGQPVQQLQPFQAQPFQHQPFQQNASVALAPGQADARAIQMVPASGFTLGYVVQAGGQGTAPRTQDPEIVRAAEIQPCMAQSAPPETPYQSMA